MSRRALFGLSAATLAAITLPGCGSDDDNAPTITRAEVQKLQDQYARRHHRGMLDRDAKLLRSIESGDLLERDLGTVALAARLHAPRAADEYTFPNSTGFPIASASGSQQQLLTVGDYSNTTNPWRNLGLYVRKGPAAPWLRVFDAGLYASDVPNFPTDEPLTPLAPDASGYAAVPSSMPGIVAKALQDPNSADAARFGASDVRQRFADDLAATQQRAATMGPVTRQYSPGSFLIAISTDGGYLVLGTFGYTQTVTARKGSSVYFAKQAVEHKVYPGHYAKLVTSWSGMFAAIVPKAGKITLVSGEEAQTGLKVS